MTSQLICVRSVQDSDFVPIVALVQRQMQRLRGASTFPLAQWDERDTLKWFEQQEQMESSLVAVNERGEVRGYVCPWLWILPECSTQHAFFTPRNGVAKMLTL